MVAHNYLVTNQNAWFVWFMALSSALKQRLVNFSPFPKLWLHCILIHPWYLDWNLVIFVCTINDLKSDYFISCGWWKLLKTLGIHVDAKLIYHYNICCCFETCQYFFIFHVPGHIWVYENVLSFHCCDERSSQRRNESWWLLCSWRNSNQCMLIKSALGRVCNTHSNISFWIWHHHVVATPCKMCSDRPWSHTAGALLVDSVHGFMGSC